MLYRALLLLITGLFITMWTLLIRSEVEPGGNSLRALPVEHVLKEMFQNEKPSQLVIHDGSQRIGTLRLTGQGEAADGTRAMQYFGNAQLEFPGAGPQRSAWNGEIVVTPDWEVKSFSLSAASRGAAKDAGPATQFELLVSTVDHTASYVIKSGPTVVDRQTFSTDEAGFTALLDHFEIDPMWRKQFHPGHGPKPVISARQASLVVDNVKLETALLTVIVNGQTLLEVHLSQLGEVLQAKTLFGWTLDVR
jgi:hypothetical protein